MSENTNIEKLFASPKEETVNEKTVYEERELGEISRATKKELLELKKKYMHAIREQDGARIFSELYNAAEARLTELNTRISRSSSAKPRANTSANSRTERITIDRNGASNAPSASISAPVIAPAAEPVIVPEANRETIDFSAEQKEVNDIIKNAMSKSPIQGLNKGSNGSFYNGSSLASIDYAIVKQPDGEFYVFGKPLQDSRFIYRLDSNKNVIGSIQINEKLEILLVKGKKITTNRYMPTPDFVSSK